MDSYNSVTHIENVDDYPATREEYSPASTHRQDHNQTQASNSDHQPVPDLARPLAAAKDDAKPSAVTDAEDTDYIRNKNLDATRKRARRTRPRCLVLVTCVSYLLFQFLGIGLGLRFINGYTFPRLNRAEIRLQATLNDLLSERIVHYKLDTLLDTTLEQQYQESYEQCLARGLFRANKVFLEIDFTPYPDARNQTMDWVMNNCDSLHFTPQLQTPSTSKFLEVMTNVRRSAEEAFALFKFRAALLRNKIRSTAQPLAAEQPVLPVHDRITANFDAPKMPFGFGLDCEGRSRCRLTHPGLDLSTLDKETVLDAAAKASKETYKWTYPWKMLLGINGHIITLLSLLQYLFLMNQLAAVLICFLDPAHHTASALRAYKAGMRAFLRNVLTRDEKLALGLVVNTSLFALLHYEFDFITSEFDRLLLPVGLGFCAFHIPQAIAFFCPAPWTAVNATQDVYSFCRAVRELYLIAQNVDVLDTVLEKESRRLPRAPATPSAAKPASKIGARFISPLTSISEDLRQERKALHAAQGKEPCDVDSQHGYATETDDEFDSDVQHASYVELTGGATPTLSEDEGWAVVEE